MSNVCACMHEHVRLGRSGGMFPQEILQIRWSEVASEAIWDKTRTVGAAWLAEYCIQFLGVHVCICMLSQLTSNFQDRRY